MPNIGLTQILHKHSFITCIHLLGLDYYLLYTRYLGNSLPIIVVRFLALVTTMVTMVDHGNHCSNDRGNDRSNHRGYYDRYYNVNA